MLLYWLMLALYGNIYMKKFPKTVAFQGYLGAYSHSASQAVFPSAKVIPCLSFEEVFDRVKNGSADVAVIPIENSIAGRVADIHHLLPKSDVFIIGEHFEPIRHQLLAIPGATLKDIKEVKSHTHALNQCRKFIHSHKLRPVHHFDTAGAALEVSELKNPHVAAIASLLAGEMYGLKILSKNIEDENHNTTRFIIVSKKQIKPPVSVPLVTSFVFRVRSVPAALYKSIGGFATNGVNITKLESYIVDEKFTLAEFYVEIEGHPDDLAVSLAFEELRFFSKNVKILGTYRAHSFRNKNLKTTNGKNR